MCIRGSSFLHGELENLHFVVAEKGGLEVVTERGDIGAVEALVEGKDWEKGGIGIGKAGADGVVGVVVAAGELSKGEGAAWGVEVAD